MEQAKNGEARGDKKRTREQFEEDEAKQPQSIEEQRTVEVRPLGGDSIYIQLGSASSIRVADAKLEIAKEDGAPVQAQELYRVAVSADGSNVREYDQEPELLKDDDQLQAGDVVQMAVKDVPQWDKVWMHEDIELSEQDTVATCITPAVYEYEEDGRQRCFEYDEDSTTGPCVRSKQPLMPNSGLHFIEFCYTKMKRHFEGNYESNEVYEEDYASSYELSFSAMKKGEGLGGCYFVGVVSSDVPNEVFAEGNREWQNCKGAWGIDDAGCLWEGSKTFQGPFRQVKDFTANSDDHIFGNDDKVGVAIDMDKGTMRFYRDGKPIGGDSDIEGVPTDKPLYLLASPCDPRTTVRVGLPDELPEGLER